MSGIITLEIGVLADLCLRLILREDPKHQLKIGKKTYAGMLMYCVAVGSWIGMFLNYWRWYGQLACGVLAAYLLVVTIQDLQTCVIYDFLHVLAAPAGLIFVLAAPSREKLLSLIVFLIIQFGIFMHMYGFGDGLVFLVCALYESRFGKGLLTYLIHMAAAYIVLCIVQAVRKNISRSGNLKRPVPLTPYITATVWIFL